MLLSSSSVVAVSVLLCCSDMSDCIVESMVKWDQCEFIVGCVV